MYLSLPEPVHMQCLRIIKKKETALPWLQSSKECQLPKKTSLCECVLPGNIWCRKGKKTHICTAWWFETWQWGHVVRVVNKSCWSQPHRAPFCFFFLQWEKEWLIVAKGNSCRIQTLALSANTAHSWVPLQQLRKQKPPQEGIWSKTIHFSDGSNYTFQFYLMSVRHFLWTATMLYHQH